MDRLKLIETLGLELERRREITRRAMDLDAEWLLAGYLADAVIRSGALRSFQGPSNEEEGATMPEGPWFGSP